MACSFKLEKWKGPMQTLHVQGSYDSRQLIKDIYQAGCLKADHKFHDFIEPVLIIRTSAADVTEKVKRCLLTKYDNFFLYDYPTPQGNGDAFGEDPKGIVIQHLDLFIKIFHSHAKPVLSSQDGKAHAVFRKRGVEVLIEKGNYTLCTQVELLKLLASYKLEKKVEDSHTTQSGEEELLEDHAVVKDLAETVNHVQTRLSFEDYILFSERVIHTLYNMSGCTRQEEGEELWRLAKKIEAQKPHRAGCQVM
jgi:hypothetical protein